jgi:hypothetical protein
METSPSFALGSLTGICVLMLLMSGCANENLADQDYGNSVRHMMALQTANPGRGTSGLDGQKAARSLEEYRKDVAKPESVDKVQLGEVITSGGSGGSGQ